MSSIDYCILGGHKLSSFSSRDAWFRDDVPLRGDVPLRVVRIVGASAVSHTARSFRLVTRAGTHVRCVAPESADRDVWTAACHSGLEASHADENADAVADSASTSSPPPLRSADACVSCGDAPADGAPAPLPQYGLEEARPLCRDCGVAQGLWRHANDLVGLHASAAHGRAALRAARARATATAERATREEAERVRLRDEEDRYWAENGGMRDFHNDHESGNSAADLRGGWTKVNLVGKSGRRREDARKRSPPSSHEKKKQSTSASWTHVSPADAGTRALLALVATPGFTTYRRRSRRLDVRCRRLESGTAGGAAEFLDDLAEDDEHDDDPDEQQRRCLRREAIGVAGDMGAAIRLLADHALPRVNRAGAPSRDRLADVLEFLLNSCENGREEGGLASVAFFWPQIRHVHLRMLPPRDADALARVELMEDFLITVSVRHDVNLGLELAWGLVADLEESLLATVDGAPPVAPRRVVDDRDDPAAPHRSASVVSPDAVDPVRRARRFAVLRFLCELESVVFRGPGGWTGGGGGVCLRDRPRATSPSPHQAVLLRETMEELRRHRDRAGHRLSRSARSDLVVERGAPWPDAERVAERFAGSVECARELGRVAEALRFENVERRRGRLEKELEKFNETCDKEIRRRGRGCFVMGGDPVADAGDAPAAIVRIPSKEGHVFRSKERTPVLLLVEVVREGEGEAPTEEEEEEEREPEENPPAHEGNEAKEPVTPVTDDANPNNEASNNDNDDDDDKDNTTNNSYDLGVEPPLTPRTSSVEDDHDVDQTPGRRRFPSLLDEDDATSTPTITTTTQRPSPIRLRRDSSDRSGPSPRSSPRVLTTGRSFGESSADGMPPPPLFSSESEVGDLVASVVKCRLEEEERASSGGGGTTTTTRTTPSAESVEGSTGAVETHDTTATTTPTKDTSSIAITTPSATTTPPATKATTSSSSSLSLTSPNTAKRAARKRISALSSLGVSSLAKGVDRREVLTTILARGMRGDSVAKGAAKAAKRAVQRMDHERAVRLILDAGKKEPRHPHDDQEEEPPEREERKDLGDDEAVEALRLLLLQNKVARERRRRRRDDAPHDSDSDSSSSSSDVAAVADAGEIDPRLSGCGPLSLAIASAVRMWREGIVSDGEVLDLVQKDLRFLRHAGHDADATGSGFAATDADAVEDSAFWVRFAFGERWAEKRARVAASSPHGTEPGWDLVGVIVKSNDDLRQEAFVMQLVGLCREAFDAAGLELWVRPYRILATGRTTGFVETVRNAISLDGLKKRPGYDGLKGHLERMAEFEPDPEAAFRTAQRNFVRSLAAYSLMSWLFLFKDRHNGNLLLDTAGHVIHIDFGFVFGIAPGGSFSLETGVPFKLTEEMLEVMGGPQSPVFSEFVTLFCCGFLCLQTHADTFCTLVEITCKGSAFNCFEGKSASEIVRKLRDRFVPNLDRAATVAFALDLIRQATTCYGTRQYDFFQYMSQGIAA